ncbi:MAG: hypothetical protein RSB77_03090 [Bacilli bacterium]
MNLIKTIKNEDFNLSPKTNSNSIKQSTTILLIDENSMVLLFKRNSLKSFYLPSMEHNEKLNENIFKKTDIILNNIKTLGYIEEHKNNGLEKVEVLMSSVKKIHKFIDDDTEMIWCNPEEAYMLIKNYTNPINDFEDLYTSLYRNKKDLEIIKYYLNNK